jgi:hypothetical protein
MVIWLRLTLVIVIEMVFLVDALQILGKKVIINYVAKLNHRPK